MLLIPELGTVRVVLVHVHVVEALRRVIAGILHERAVGALHVAEASDARGLHAARPRLRDLRLGQARGATGARPGIAADEDRAALVARVEGQEGDLGARLVRVEAGARVNDVPAEMPEGTLRRGDGRRRDAVE